MEEQKDTLRDALSDFQRDLWDSLQQAVQQAVLQALQIVLQAQPPPVPQHQIGDKDIIDNYLALIDLLRSLPIDSTSCSSCDG